MKGFNPFSTALYRTALYTNTFLTLNPSNLSPKRECGPKRAMKPYPFSTALYRTTLLTRIPSNIFRNGSAVVKGLQQPHPFSTALYRTALQGYNNPSHLVPHCTEPHCTQTRFSLQIQVTIRLTLNPSNLSPKRECGLKGGRWPVSTALYRNIHVTLICNISPDRECGLKRVKCPGGTALHRNIDSSILLYVPSVL